MPLHPTYPIPERILSYGPAGAGKSTNWLNICKWAVRTKLDTHFYVLDSDASIPRMLINYPECIPFITIYPCYDWTDYMNAQKEVLSKARPLIDWVVVDFASAAWQTVQSYYVEQVFHQDIGSYFLQARKELSKDASSLNALEGWVDWSVINPLYRKWINPLVYKGQYHLYCTATAEQLSSDRKPTEDKDIRSLFVKHNSKPAGQKHLPHQFHTILLNGLTPRDTRVKTITSIKDREREMVAGKVITNFTKDYLVDIAKWSLV